MGWSVVCICLLFYTVFADGSIAMLMSMTASRSHGAPKAPDVVFDGTQVEESETKLLKTSATNSTYNLNFQFTEILKFFNTTSPTNTSLLIDIIERAEEQDLIDESQKLILEISKHPKYFNSSKTDIFNAYDIILQKIPHFPRFFASQFKLLSFNFKAFLNVLTKFDELPYSQKKELLTKFSEYSNSSGSAFEFLDRFNEQPRGIYWIERLGYTLLPNIRKIPSANFWKHVIISLSVWEEMDEKRKEVARRVMVTTNYTECLSTWKSYEKDKLVQFMSMMDTELQSGSCFWRIFSRISPPSTLRIQDYAPKYGKTTFYEIEKMNEYWIGCEILNHETLIDILVVSDSTDLVNEMGKSIVLDSEFWEIQLRAINIGSSLLKWMDKWFRKIPQFSFYFEEMIVVNIGFDASVVTQIIDDFSALSIEEKQNFLNSLDKKFDTGMVSGSMLRFFNRLNELEKPAYHLQRYAGELLRHCRTTHLFVWRALTDAMDVYESLSVEGKKKAHEFFEELNEIDCEKFMEEEPEGSKIINVMKYLYPITKFQKCLVK